MLELYMCTTEMLYFISCLYMHVCIYVCAHTNVPWYACGIQRTILGNWFFPSTMGFADETQVIKVCMASTSTKPAASQPDILLLCMCVTPSGLKL